MNFTPNTKKFDNQNGDPASPHQAFDRGDEPSTTYKLTDGRAEASTNSMDSMPNHLSSKSPKARRE